ncbi:phosphate ABC transporter substrate-binding protein [Pseudogulbenkiania sp. MAI-1]|uniref:phosphate ABC transporter substrate-binding protein n=1 Tax=Pseudogulbenkiania sp. MAI-1 TaxID=990370 RepID=UPI0004B56F6F|nr:phosphate ABC transporter substrate-binding protein [Pseudogulbenkiania sp. MAI-1]
MPTVDHGHSLFKHALCFKHDGSDEEDFMSGPNKLFRTLSIAVFLCIGAAGAETGPTPMSTAPAALSGRLLLTGSSTMAPLMMDIGKRFQSLHHGVQVEVQTGGSGRGISDAREGKADIGMASRALSDKEADLYGVPIARDGICLIVHRDNLVRSLSNRQIVGIFTGRITRWDKLGGRNQPITVLNPKPSYSSAELFSQYFNLKYEDIKASRQTGDNAVRIAEIANDPNGISYTSVGEAERKMQAGVPIRLLALDGVPATSKNIRNGNFPISRPLTLVTKTTPSGLTRTFIEFALSPQVTDLVQANDFVPYLD